MQLLLLLIYTTLWCLIDVPNQFFFWNFPPRTFLFEPPPPPAYSFCSKQLRQPFLKRDIRSVWNILNFHFVVLIFNFVFSFSISQKKLIQYNAHFIVIFSFFDSEMHIHLFRKIKKLLTYGNLYLYYKIYKIRMFICNVYLFFKR